MLGDSTAAGKKLPGMFETMVSMYKNEGGFLALYRGIVPTVAGVAPYVSVYIAKEPYFLTNQGSLSRLVSISWFTNQSDDILRQRERKTLAPLGNYSLVQYLERQLRHAPIPCMSIPLSLLEAAVLTICHSDVLRRRFQINTMTGMGYQYKSILDAIRVIVRDEGVRGLYKGIVPNLLKVAPSMASSWLSFELTRDFLLSINER